MKITENELENRLRQAPAPQPPAALRDKLIDEISLSPNNVRGRSGQFRWSGWLQSWKPSLAMGAIMIACIATLAVQQNKIRDLRQSITLLEEKMQSAKLASQPGEAQNETSVDAPGSSVVASRAELAELPATIEKLKEEIKGLETLRTENAKLRHQLSAYSGLSEEETQGLKQAKDRADRIKCVNNLKNIGLAARIYSTDNGDVFPPNMLSMSDQLGTPKILICPADTQRTAASNWQEFGIDNTSYEYLAPSINDSAEPNRVLFRCSIHNNICLADGSVQQAEKSLDQIVQVNGKTYFGNPTEGVKPSSTTRTVTPATTPAATPEAGMSEAMRKRYGLPPSTPNEPAN